MTDSKDQIRTLLATYQRAFDASDAALAASCYTPDGVFMPTTLPTATAAQVAAAYRAIFDVISLDVEFTVDELVVTSDATGYALTRSNGTQTVLATGSSSAEANREIFLFARDAGGWRIARYMFNKAS